VLRGHSPYLRSQARSSGFGALSITALGAATGTAPLIGSHRRAAQSFLLPEALDDYVTDTNPVRVVDVFVDELDLHKLGFEGVEPALTGRPSYHPEVMLKIYIYGYLNRIQSSRRLEREAQRNVELMNERDFPVPRLRRKPQIGTRVL
jgi:hypothetical protein